MIGKLTKAQLIERLEASEADLADMTKAKVSVIRKGRIEDEVEIARLNALVKELRAELIAGPDVED